MQVMTKVHNDKYEAFGGRLAAFDPVSNLRVGVLVLKECIAKAGGGLEAGLHYYVGAGTNEEDGGYASKVLAEHEFLKRVAAGQTVSPTVSLLANAAPAAVHGAAAPAASAVAPAPEEKPTARDLVAEKPAAREQLALAR